jgi:hypothetical protein
MEGEGKSDCDRQDDDVQITALSNCDASRDKRIRSVPLTNHFLSAVLRSANNAIRSIAQAVWHSICLDAEAPCFRLPFFRCAALPVANAGQLFFFGSRVLIDNFAHANPCSILSGSGEKAIQVLIGEAKNLAASDRMRGFFASLRMTTV